MAGTGVAPVPAALAAPREPVRRPSTGSAGGLGGLDDDAGHDAWVGDHGQARGVDLGDVGVRAVGHEQLLGRGERHHGDQRPGLSHTVTRRIVAWVEEAYTNPDYQRCGLAAAALAALCSEHPGLEWFGLAAISAIQNPGPFLTGFNDRMFQTWESWEDDPSQRLFDYSKLAFPRAQFDPEVVYATLTAVAAGEVDQYRNLEPSGDRPCSMK